MSINRKRQRRKRRRDRARARYRDHVATVRAYGRPGWTIETGWWRGAPNGGDIRIDWGDKDVVEIFKL